MYGVFYVVKYQLISKLSYCRQNRRNHLLFFDTTSTRRFDHKNRYFGKLLTSTEARGSSPRVPSIMMNLSLN